MNLVFLIFLSATLGLVLSALFRVIALISAIFCAWGLLICGLLLGRLEIGNLEFGLWMVLTAVAIQIGYFGGVLIRAYWFPKPDTAGPPKPVIHSRH